MTSPTPDNPQWSSDLFREGDDVAGPLGHGRGLVGHVPIVAALLMVQGILELGFGLFGLAFTAITFLMPRGEGDMRGLGVMMAVITGPLLVIGALRIVAGLFNYRYRRRTLGMVALGAGLLSVFTFYCAPTAIAISVYGLIVYLNEPVAAAFALGDSGRSAANVNAAFPAR
jgi:hypothetical protein